MGNIKNTGFKTTEFDNFRKQVGLNAFHLTPRKWIEATDATGLISIAGRHKGGTYAQKDIAFEFGTWLSPEFKLYLIKEFQRLKEQEAEDEQWDYRRFLARVNYHLQTNAVQKSLVPISSLPIGLHSILYAKEADLLNLA